MSTPASSAPRTQDMAQAAARLHAAFRELENRILLLKEQPVNQQMLEDLQQENAQLRGVIAPLEEENRQLRDSVYAMQAEMDEAIARTESLLALVTD